MINKLVYIVGSGGREAALGQALSQYEVGQFKDKKSTLEAVSNRKPDLVVVGSEQPLVDGLADELRELGVTVFGPNKKAAQLEGSKAFTESFLERHDISRPKSETVTPDTFETYKLPADVSTIVLKADGLAGGKGVVLPKTNAEASRVLDSMLSGDLHGDAGKKVVIQERLHGPELSVFVVTDGTKYIILPYTQDHKRLKDNDEGPNTGGMGAYTPVPESIVSKSQSEKIETIVKRTIEGMRADENEFRGVLFVGLILAKERGGDPAVIEYNVRFGDPEAQVLIPYISDSVDLFQLLESTDANLIDAPDLGRGTHFITVCLAAEGYPANPKTDQLVIGLDKDYKNVNIYKAALVEKDHKHYTSGGRVLYVTGYGESIDEAAKYAYNAIGESGVHFKGMQYRTDIGWQARSTNVLE